MLKKKLKLAMYALAAAGLSMAQTANADVACAGPVYDVHVSRDGALLIRFASFGMMNICFLGGTVNAPTLPVTKESCQGIMTLALTAKGTGKDFSVTIPTPAGTSCSSFAPGSGLWPNYQPYDFAVLN